LSAEFQRGELTNAEQSDRVSEVEIKLNAIRLEGGVKPNPKLWLSVQWSAQLHSAGTSEAAYSTGGVWQSNKEQVFQKWAHGTELAESLREASRQIAAVFAEQVR
jgi:hypothetical protein